MSEEISFEQVCEGDRITVTQVFEGVAQEVRDRLIRIRTDGGENVGITDDEALCREQTIERIEPEYVPGGVYLSANNAIYIYDPKDGDAGCSWKLANTLERRVFDWPERPMTRLEKRR